MPVLSEGHVAVLDWSVASAAYPGEVESGDLCMVKPFPDGVMIAVVDGVGHGRLAADAAQKAVAAIEQQSTWSLVPLVRRCHDALIGTRGVVMTLVSLNSTDNTISWIGIGNICGALVRADGRALPRSEMIVPRAGVVGLQLPSLQASHLTLAKGDLVVFATDGVRPEFTERLSPALSPRQLAERALTGFGRGTDDALVFAARYLGAGGREQ